MLRSIERLELKMASRLRESSLETLGTFSFPGPERVKRPLPVADDVVSDEGFSKDLEALFNDHPEPPVGIMDNIMGNIPLGDGHLMDNDNVEAPAAKQILLSDQSQLVVTHCEDTQEVNEATEIGPGDNNGQDNSANIVPVPNEVVQPRYNLRDRSKLKAPTRLE
jgi:hypothetical protein